MPNADQIVEALAELLAPKVAEILGDRSTVEDDTGDGWVDEPLPEPASEQDEADPWGAPEPTRQPAKRSASRTASRGGGSSRAASRGSSNRGNSGGGNRGGSSRNSSVPARGEYEDDKGKTWVFGLEDAPVCEGNQSHDSEPCAEVSGVGSNGRDYTAWACAHGFKDWRNKCGTFDFGR